MNHTDGTDEKDKKRMKTNLITEQQIRQQIQNLIKMEQLQTLISQTELTIQILLTVQTDLLQTTQTTPVQQNQRLPQTTAELLHSKTTITKYLNSNLIYLDLPVQVFLLFVKSWVNYFTLLSLCLFRYLHPYFSDSLFFHFQILKCTPSASSSHCPESFGMYPSSSIKYPESVS